MPNGPVFVWIREGKGWVRKSLKYHKYPPEGTALYTKPGYQVEVKCLLVSASLLFGISSGAEEQR